MGASQSTSSTTTNHDNGRKYDVFISFRSEETGDNFTSHLYDALCRKRIHTFIDHGLKRGHEISPALLEAIEDSRISIVIFSKQYASSKRCLRELAEIMKYKKIKKQSVIPVFYHVDPSDVRKQTGSFKDAFDKHRKESREELQIWRDALTEASNLSGWHSSVIRSESRLVVEIMKDVLNKLKDVSPSNNYRGLVGIHSRIEKIKSLLSIEMLDVRIVGIWGMGGIGKTTVAEAVFDEISCQFEGRCFVTNVREESEKCGGLICLRDQILSTILEEKVNLGTPNIPVFIKRRLQSKKIIVVLDDVNNWRQLEVLAGGLNKFGPGSRIIVTSRDKQVLLNSRVAEDNIYAVEELDNSEALQLFCKYAFKQDQLAVDLMVFAHVVVDYAKGNPLALKVVGSSLYRRSRQDWESALLKLKKIPNVEIRNMLRISYDGLDNEEKDIFLDIACYFKGQSRGSTMQKLNSCYFSAQAGLSALIDKSFITISGHNIEVHDLLQEMGWDIVRQESISNLGERSRLHNHEDVYLLLKRNIGSEAVKGMFLNMSKINSVNMSSEAFEKMGNIRFFKFYNSDGYIEDSTSISSKVQLPSGLSCLPDRLSYFNWDGFPLNVLPSNVNLDYLVELDLFDSKVDQLWEGKKHAPMLKWFVLGNSRHLASMPDLSGSPSLEVIDLTGCRSLLDISSSIQHLKNLKQLRLTGCEGLGSFSRSIHFESRINVNLASCTKLTKFPQISGNIDILTLSETAIEEVPSSIECLAKLRTLDLSNSARLKHISTSLYKLKSLAVLNLSYCNLTEIPEDIGCLSMLEDLNLSGNSFQSLPKSIKQLYKLSNLSVDDCNMLQSLTDLPLGLQYLDAENCKRLSSLPDASYFAERVTKYYSNEDLFLRFTLTNGLTFDSKEFGNVLALSLLLISEHMEITEKEYQDEKNRNNHAIGIFCPGSEIPEWFSDQSSGSFIDIQLPQHNWCNKQLVGLFFCIVFPSKKHLRYMHDCRKIPYECDFKTNYGDQAHCRGALDFNSPIVGSDHIFLGFINCSHFKLHGDHYTTGSFAFWSPNYRVKSCGVSLIYVRANVSQPSFSVEGTAIEDFVETTVEEHTETREFLDEADTSGSASGISDNKEMDSHPKRFHAFKSIFSNNRVDLFYHTMRDRASLLCHYGWIFLLCLFCGLCVFGMLGLLLLHLSTLCEIYLSSHTQITQGGRL